MKKYVKILFLLVSFCAVVLCLNSCNQSNPDNSEEKSSVQTTNTERIEEMGTNFFDSRFMVFGIWNFTITPQSTLEAAADRVAESGFNAIRLHLPWFHVEKEPGIYDYSVFDAQIDYIINVKKMKVAISVDLCREVTIDSGRNITYSDKVIDKEDFQVNSKGELCVGGAYINKAVISYASGPATDKAVAFYADAVRRYSEKYGNMILYYVPTFTQYCETEYWCADTYDYSKHMTDGFKKFLKDKYKTIEQLNDATNKDFTDFGVIEPPASFSGEYGKQWYLYRHAVLKNFIDRLCDAQHEIAPQSKTALQFGSVFDEASALRCTYKFIDLAEKADIVWVDDAPNYDHNFSMDYLKSNLDGKEFANEMDGAYHIVNGTATPEIYLKQAAETFRHHANYLSVANWSVDENFEKYRYIFTETSEQYHNDTPDLVQVSPDAPEIKVSLADMFKRRSSTKLIKEYNELSDKGKNFVRITIIDDLN